MPITSIKYKVIDQKILREYDNSFYELGFRKIEFYRYQIFHDSGKKQRTYIIELHYNAGFALIKFYPKNLIKASNRYEKRVIDLKYSLLSYRRIRALFEECVIIMKNYLNENRNNLIGYFGQPDKRDHKNQKRIYAQRCSVYDTISLNLFTEPQYIINSKEQFGEINCRYIQNGIDCDQKVIKENQNSFLNLIKNTLSEHSKMMTKVTREKYFDDFS